MMAKARELREMSGEQLEFALKEAREDLFNMRVKSTTEKLDTPSNIRKRRQEIARILTIQSERAQSTAN
jgi:large subunit ribosomal protein L29